MSNNQESQDFHNPSTVYQTLRGALRMQKPSIRPLFMPPDADRSFIPNTGVKLDSLK